MISLVYQLLVAGKWCLSLALLYVCFPKSELSDGDTHHEGEEHDYGELLAIVLVWALQYPHIDGILTKGPYPPCLRMADRALLAGYPRYTQHKFGLLHLCLFGFLDGQSGSYEERQLHGHPVLRVATFRIRCACPWSNLSHHEPNVLSMKQSSFRNLRGILV